MAIVTETQLTNAAADCQTIEDVVNGGAAFGGDGLVHPRTGGDLKTLSKIQDEIETTGTGWLQTAEDWATKTDGIVAATDYSAKAWSVGGTGVTDTASAGAAKEWATKAEDSTVDGTEFSSKHYAAKASASAAAAVSAAAEGLYNDVISIDNTDSPYAPVLAQEGTLFRCDCTSGNIVINLDELTNYGEDMKFAFVKVDASANTITINRGGSTDTINGTTSIVIASQYTIHVLVGDSATGTWVAAIQSLTLADNSVTLAKLEHGTQGDILYYGASGEPFRLSAGTSGQVLKTNGAGANPSWGNETKGLNLLASYTFSADTQVDIGSGLDVDAAIDGTYDEYVIDLVSLVFSTDSNILCLRTSTDGGTTFSTTSNSYSMAIEGNTSGSSGLQFASNTLGYIALNPTSGADLLIGNAAGESFSATLRLFDPSNSALYTKIQADTCYVSSQGNIARGIISAMRSNAEDVDALRIFPTSGNITSGKIRVYGVSNS